MDLPTLTVLANDIISKLSILQKEGQLLVSIQEGPIDHIGGTVIQDPWEKHLLHIHIHVMSRKKAEKQKEEENKE